MGIDRGVFIVVEGTDGSGKSTQIRPLSEHLKSVGIRHRVIDFPRYTDNVWGELIGRYLKGEFGGLEINPHLASLPYVLDRVLATPKINAWRNDGKMVIANRYVASNLAFMGARLPADRRWEFIHWLENAEYNETRIPREDLVLLLNVTPDISQKNVDRKDVREYMGVQKRDIHEAELDYQTRVAQVYLELAQRNNHWRVINCMNGNKLRTPVSISQDLITILRSEGIIPNA